jgi:hypothetical protein
MSSMVTKKIGCSTCILLYKHPHANITNIQYPTNFHTPNKTSRLHTIIWAKENKLIKLCARNYATFDSFIIEQIESSNSQEHTLKKREYG